MAKDVEKEFLGKKGKIISVVKVSRFRGPGRGKQCPKCSQPNRRACTCRGVR